MLISDDALAAALEYLDYSTDHQITIPRVGLRMVYLDLIALRQLAREAVAEMDKRAYRKHHPVGDALRAHLEGNDAEKP